MIRGDTKLVDRPRDKNLDKHPKFQTSQRRLRRRRKRRLYNPASNSPLAAKAKASQSSKVKATLVQEAKEGAREVLPGAVSSGSIVEAASGGGDADPGPCDLDHPDDAGVRAVPAAGGAGGQAAGARGVHHAAAAAATGVVGVGARRGAARHEPHDVIERGALWWAEARGRLGFSFHQPLPPCLRWIYRRSVGREDFSFQPPPVTVTCHRHDRCSYPVQSQSCIVVLDLPVMCFSSFCWMRTCFIPPPCSFGLSATSQ